MPIGPIFRSAGGGGPPVFDAASSIPALGASVTSITWNHTCTGTNRAVFVGANWYAGTEAPSGATYDGVGMTMIGAKVDGAQGQASALWALSNPPTGSKAIVVSWGVTIAEAAGCAVSFTNAHQTTASLTGTRATAANCTTGINVTSATDEIVVDIAGATNGDLTTNASGQTERADCAFSGTTTCAMSTKPGEASTALDWTHANGDAHIGVSVKPPA